MISTVCTNNLNIFFRYLFWTEVGNTAQIGRSNMDGTSKSYIVTADLGWPNGLAIDFACIFCIASTSFPFHTKYVFFLKIIMVTCTFQYY